MDVTYLPFSKFKTGHLLFFHLKNNYHSKQYFNVVFFTFAKDRDVKVYTGTFTNTTSTLRVLHKLYTSPTGLYYSIKASKHTTFSKLLHVYKRDVMLYSEIKAQR